MIYMYYMYPYPYYRQNGWANVFTLLQQSLYAEGMVCSMSTQMLYNPETKDLKGNTKMHDHLVPASYHRVTASGSAYRLTAGESDPYIVTTAVSCIKNAQKQDQGVREGLQIMQENANDKWRPFVEQIIKWQDVAESTLTQAQETMQSMNAWESTQ